jgi:hypothetical protein
MLDHGAEWPLQGAKGAEMALGRLNGLQRLSGYGPAQFRVYVLRQGRRIAPIEPVEGYSVPGAEFDGYRHGDDSITALVLRPPIRRHGDLPADLGLLEPKGLTGRYKPFGYGFGAIHDVNNGESTRLRHFQDVKA